MAQPIIACLDFSDNSDEAALHAVSVAQPGDSLILVHVVRPIPYLMHNYIDTAAMLRAIEKRVEQLMAEREKTARAALPEGVTLTTSLLHPKFEDGDVREELLQFIKVKNPKCTFAGARGGGRLSRAIIGSTSDYLVHQLECAIFIVRNDAPKAVMGNHKWIVCYDGSTESTKAAEKSLAIFKPQDQVHLLTVSVKALSSKQNEKADELLKKLKEQRQDVNFSRSAVVSKSKPGTVICEQCKALEASYAITGARGVHGMKRFLLGSVSDYCTRYSPCPVLIIR